MSQRDALSAGFYEGRSPDLLAVTGSINVYGDTSGTSSSPWPGPNDDERVPLVFWGGARRGAEIPAGTTLDVIAPTLADHIGLDRPHPNVRSGKALAGVMNDVEPRLVILIALKNVGRREFNRSNWSRLNELGRDGAFTDRATPGSLPLDPTAVLATIGTGGLPYQHGITGSLLRNQTGEVVRAWGSAGPGSVIATVADHMDELQRQRPKIGLVQTSPADRGLIGGDWYPDVDRDIVRTAASPEAAVRATSGILRKGFGADETTDLMGVVLEGAPAELDRALGELVRLGRRASSDRLTAVVVGTGSPGDDRDAVSASALTARAERVTPGSDNLIAGATSGGFFVDQGALTRTGRAEDQIVRALLGLRRNDAALFTDVFADITVAFGEFC